MKSFTPKLRTRRLAGKMFSLAGLFAVLFFVFIYLFPWIKTDSGKAIGFACIGVLAVYFVSFLIWIKKTGEPDAAEFFLITAIPLSAIFLILLPHNCFVDNKTHFIAVYRLSNLIMGKGEWLCRADDLKFMNELWPDVARPETKGYQAIVTAASWFIKDETLVDIVRHEDKMKFYSIVCYLPEVLGFTAARLLKLGTVPSVYISRACLNIFYIIACFHAIKIMPSGKFALAFTALLPESLHIAGAFSYDGMAVACAICFTASCFCLADSVRREKEKNSKIFSRDLVRCMIWSFVCASVKGGGYFFLLIPVAFLPASRKKARSFIRPVLVIASGLLALLIFNVIVTYGISLFQLGGEEGNLTTAFAFQNPLSFLIMAAYEYVFELEAIFMGITGGMLSWGDFVVPGVIITALIVIMMAYLVFEKDDIRFTNYAKRLMIISIVLALVITPAMMLSSTPTDSRNIFGIQGRYFTPFVPMVFILATKFKIHRKAIAATDGRIQLKIRKRLLTAVASFFCIIVYLMLNTYLKR